MIRECFKVNTGIIFDAHMLQHEVGLDIDSIVDAPPPLPPSTLHLAGSDDAEDKVAFPSSPQTIRSFEKPRFVSEGEHQEELDDALSPIYDQMKKRVYWKIMEWIPCKLCPSFNSSASAARAHATPKGIIGRQGAELNNSNNFWIHRPV